MAITTAYLYDVYIDRLYNYYILYTINHTSVSFPQGTTQFMSFSKIAKDLRWACRSDHRLDVQRHSTGIQRPPWRLVYASNKWLFLKLLLSLVERDRFFVVLGLVKSWKSSYSTYFGDPKPEPTRTESMQADLLGSQPQPGQGPRKALCPPGN